MACRNSSIDLAAQEHANDLRCDSFADGSLYQCIYEQGGRDIDHVMRARHSALPKLFDRTERSPQKP